MDAQPRALLVNAQPQAAKILSRCYHPRVYKPSGLTTCPSFMPAKALKVYQSGEQFGLRTVLRPNFNKRTEPSAKQNCTPPRWRLLKVGQPAPGKLLPKV